MAIELLSDTRKIIEEVRAITGKDIEFRENNKLNTYAIAKLARTRMPSHIIYYKAMHDDIINYIIAHECGHFIRMYKEQNNRLMAYSDDDTMSRALADLERNSTVNYPADVKAKVFPLWINGIVTQLTSVPEDVRIEKWMYENYPELRLTQNQALMKQSNDISAAMKPEIKKMAPPLIYDGSSIMNYFFLRSLSDVVKSNALSMMKSATFFQKAVKIFSDVEAIMKKEDSLSNGIEVTDYLAKNLGFDGWFRWKDFEDIPSEYEDAIYY